MKISEAILRLEEYKEHYGDCRLVKLDHANNNVVDIDDFDFIGGDRVLLKANDRNEELSFRWYILMEEIANQKRKKDWQKDCE